MLNFVHFDGEDMKQQVKSKQRVADHGEVFTAEREVNAMLDLVKQETERIDSRFLEPACGDGNFLAEILRRKLAVVKRMYGKNSMDYEKYAIIAATSIYGVDILQDNVEACRNRMFDIWNKEYTDNCKNDATDEIREVAKFIFRKNILCGNALSMMCVDENGNNTDEYITFAEWNFVMGSSIKRRDYRLDEMLEGHNNQMSLFMDGWEFDEETNAFIPTPIKEYPLTDYRRLADYE